MTARSPVAAPLVPNHRQRSSVDRHRLVGSPSRGTSLRPLPVSAPVAPAHQPHPLTSVAPLISFAILYT